ncbi:MAG: toxic anion resistance protein, partial [Eubacteriales bacterium]|nr:toxic anion resistance protein [Eubacteriales bacterium]
MNDLGSVEAPSLTLDFAPAEEKPVETAAAPVTVEDTPLSDAERKMVQDFAQQIDLKNSAMILNYGAASQKKIADFSGAALESVRTKDLGEVGDMITGLVTELKGFDATAEQPKGLFGLFKKAGNQLDEMKLKYSKAETNVERITSALEGHQVTLLKDIKMLDKMYEKNLVYFKELSMYILAGKQKLAEARGAELPALLAKAQSSGLPEDAQAARDFDDLCGRFEKKLYDLELTRTISIQMAPQIRLVQNNDAMMAEKIQSSLVNTIPLWKSQMVLALGLANSQQAIQAQRAVTDMTNELLKKNAAALKMGTIEAARESERGIVDIETLQQTNRSLIETLDDVLKIQSEGRQKRAAAEEELGKLEGEQRAVTDMTNELLKKNAAALKMG